MSLRRKLPAFHTPVPLSIRFTSRKALDPRAMPKACLEEPNPPPAGNTRRASPATNSSTQLQSPRRSHEGRLLYRPEAVLSLLAIGFMASVAFLANAGRRIAADVSLRAKKITQENLQARLYKARLEEKEFLESAIEATTATLNNTEDFLAKQLKRAEVAEERLRDLEVNSAEIDAAARKAKELKIELRRKEAELEDSRRSTDENSTLLIQLQTDVSKRRDSLADFERDLKEAQNELATSQKLAATTLESALGEKERLQLVLDQKEAQLIEEMTARDDFMKRVGEEERKLQRTEVVVDRTLSDIETRRKKIDSVAKEAEVLGKVASQEKLALETSIVQEIRPEDVEDSLRQIGERQKVLRERIQSSLRSEAQQAALCTNLRKEIRERDKVLQEQRAQLDAIRIGTQQFSPSRTKINGTSESKSSERSDITHEVAGGINMNDISESAVINDNIHSTPVLKTTSTESAATVGTKNEDDAAPIKRRRGRPRKAETERSQEPGVASTKRGRGRPRKKRIEDDTPKETTLRKKRGRPKKASAAATRDNTVKGLSS